MKLHKQATNVVWAMFLIVALVAMQSVRVHVHVHSHVNHAGGLVHQHGHHDEFGMAHDALTDIHFDDSGQVEINKAGALSKLFLDSLFLAFFVAAWLLVRIAGAQREHWPTTGDVFPRSHSLAFLPPSRAPPV